MQIDDRANLFFMHNILQKNSLLYAYRIEDPDTDIVQIQTKLSIRTLVFLLYKNIFRHPRW